MMRIKKKKESLGKNTKTIVRNSSYQIVTNIVAKIGSLFFTIIIARMLMPELFGLYSLALTTIMVFSVISDLGIGYAVTRFVSRELGKKKGNPKGYFTYIRNLKLGLTFLAILALALSSYFVANNIYNKPIFYALLAGTLYIFANQFLAFFADIFRARNNFARPLFKEIVSQVFRLILVPLTVILTLSYSNEIRLFWIFISLSLAYSISFLTLIYKNKTLKGKSLSKKEKKEVRRFILPLSATTLAGVFYGYIDQMMLGRYITSEFIGYYAAAFSLIGAAAAVIAFSGALLPVFSRINTEKLKENLHNIIIFNLVLSLLAILVTFFVAKYIILIIYGQEYLQAVLILQILSPLLLTVSTNGIFSSYFIAKGNTSFLAKFLISTTLLNIVLNFFFINYGLKSSFYIAAIGAAVATVISQLVYLFLLFIGSRKSSF